MKGKCVILSGLILLAATGFAWAEAASSCERAAQWVEAHAGNLPSTYDELTTYPTAHLRAIFAALPADVKAGIWHTHLDRWVESHADLDAEQLAVVDEVRAVLDSGIFDVMDDPAKYQANVERLLSLEERALGVMTAAEIEGAFVDLGSLRTAAAIQIDEDETQEPNCDCAVGEPGVTVQRCPDGQTCKDGGCTRTGAGCGLLTYIECHGLCKAKVSIWPWDIEAP